MTSNKRTAADEDDFGRVVKRPRTVRVSVDGAEDEGYEADVDVVAESSPPVRVLSAFESLPGEVRNMIYTYCLESGKSIIPWTPEIPADASRPAQIRLVPRTVVRMALGFGKKISREVLTHIYGMNKFAISNPFHKPWVNRIGRANGACIRDITIHCGGNTHRCTNYMTSMQRALEKRFTNLRSIEYNCEWYPMDKDNLMVAMTAKHMARSWKSFKQPESINVQHFDMPAEIREKSPAMELFVKLCTQSKIRVVATGSQRATRRQRDFLKDRIAFEWSEAEERVVRMVSQQRRRDS